MAACVAAAVLYFIVDPAQSSYMPKCIFHSLTGYSCPGCGTQRAIHSLLHGRFLDAMGQNALFVFFLPLLPILLWVEYSRQRRPALYLKVYGAPAAIGAVVVIVAWMLLRNIFGI